MQPKRLAVHRSIRLALKIGWALVHQSHPFLAQVIVTRRCNLACTYCNEFDSISAPVQSDVLRRRIDLLANLGTAVITFSGGEPLLHPEIDTLIAHARKRGAMATMITNGYLLTHELIQKLNRAGLDHLQISIDNIEPDNVSKKSLRLLDKKLVWLADQARFNVSINSVLGAGNANPGEALEVARRARELRFASSVAIVHDGHGRLRPLSGEAKAVYDQIRRMSGSRLTSLNGASLTTSRRASQTCGGAGQARGSYISTSSASCSTAPKSAARRRSRSSPTVLPITNASTTPRRLAPRSAL